MGENAQAKVPSPAPMSPSVADKDNKARTFAAFAPAQVAATRHRSPFLAAAGVACLSAFFVVLLVGATLWWDVQHSGQGEWKLKRIHLDASSSARHLQMQVESLAWKDGSGVMRIGDWHKLQFIEAACEVTSMTNAALRVNIDVRGVGSNLVQTVVEVQEGSLQGLIESLGNPGSLSSTCRSQWALDVFCSGLEVQIPYNFDGWSSLDRASLGPLLNGQESPLSTLRVEAVDKKVFREAAIGDEAEVVLDENGEPHHNLSNEGVVVGEASYRVAVDFQPGTFDPSWLDVSLTLDADLCYRERSREAFQVCMAAGERMEKALDSAGVLHVSIPLMVSGRVDGFALSAIMFGSQEDHPAESNTTANSPDVVASMQFESSTPDSALAVLLGASHSLSCRNEPPREPSGGEGSRRLASPTSSVVRQQGFYLDDVGFAGFYIFIDKGDFTQPSIFDSSFHIRNPRTYIFDWLEKWFGIQMTWNVTAVTYDHKANFTLGMTGRALNKSLHFETNYSRFEEGLFEHHEFNISKLRTSIDITNHYNDDLEVVLRINKLNITISKSAWEDKGFFDDGYTLSFMVEEGDESLAPEDTVWDEEEESDPAGFLEASGTVIEDIADSSMPDEMKEQVDDAQVEGSQLRESVKTRVKDFLQFWKDWMADVEFSDLKQWWKDTKAAWKERKQRLQEAKQELYFAQISGKLSVGTKIRRDLQSQGIESLREVVSSLSMDGLCARSKESSQAELCQESSCCAEALITFFKGSIEKGRKRLDQLREVVDTNVNFTTYTDDGWDFEARSFFAVRNFQPHLKCSYRQPQEDLKTVDVIVFTNDTTPWFYVSANVSGTGDEKSIQASMKNKDEEPMLFVEVIRLKVRDPSTSDVLAQSMQVNCLTGTGRTWLASNATIWKALSASELASYKDSFFATWDIGPSVDRQASFGVSAVNRYDNIVSGNLWCAVDSAKILSVNGTASYNSKGVHDGFSLGAYYGNDWAKSIFTLQGAADQHLDGFIDFNDETLVTLNSDITGQVVFKLFGTKFLTLEMGVTQPEESPTIMLYLIVRQGPYNLRLGSGSFELQPANRQAVVYTIKVENGWHIRLFKLAGELNRDTRMAAAKIYYGIRKYPVTATWSDGFIPDDDDPTRRNFTGGLGIQVGIYKTQMLLVLQKNGYSDIRVADFDLETTERQIRWRDAQPTLPDMPSADSSYSAARLTMLLTDADFSDVKAQDLVSSVVSMVELPEENIFAVFENITVATSYQVMDTIRYCSAEVAAATSDVAVVSSGAVEATSNGEEVECDRGNETIVFFADPVLWEMSISVADLEEAVSVGSELLSTTNGGFAARLLSAAMDPSRLITSTSLTAARMSGPSLTLRVELQFHSNDLEGIPDVQMDDLRMTLSEVFGDGVKITLESLQNATCSACVSADGSKEDMDFSDLAYAPSAVPVLAAVVIFFCLAF